MSLKYSSNDTSKTKKTFLRFICFGKDVRLGFRDRDVFSTLCHQYFLAKARPSATSIIAATGYRRETVRDCLGRLSEFGIWDGKRPVYKEGVFLETKAFKVAKWWKSVHSRRVDHRAAKGGPMVGRLDRKWAGNTVRKSDRLADTALAFIQYTTWRGKRCTTAYLMRVMGVDNRRTLQMATARLVTAGLLRRSSRLGFEAISTDQQRAEPGPDLHVDTDRMAIDPILTIDSDRVLEDVKKSDVGLFHRFLTIRDDYPQLWKASVTSCQKRVGGLNVRHLANTLEKVGRNKYPDWRTN